MKDIPRGWLQHLFLGIDLWTQQGGSIEDLTRPERAPHVQNDCKAGPKRSTSWEGMAWHQVPLGVGCLWVQGDISMPGVPETLHQPVLVCDLTGRCESFFISGYSVQNQSPIWTLCSPSVIVGVTCTIKVKFHSLKVIIAKGQALYSCTEEEKHTS